MDKLVELTDCFALERLVCSWVSRLNWLCSCRITSLIEGRVQYFVVKESGSTHAISGDCSQLCGINCELILDFSGTNCLGSAQAMNWTSSEYTGRSQRGAKTPVVFGFFLSLSVLSHPLFVWETSGGLFWFWLQRIMIFNLEKPASLVLSPGCNKRFLY